MKHPATVAQLAGRFRVRARASRSTYLAGRSLAERGAVRLVHVDPDGVIAKVVDRTTLSVEVTCADDDLAIVCSCGEAAGAGVCRHAVAVEHALWLQTTRAPRP